MSSIFISHSSGDNVAALELAEWLTAQGHRSTFLDFDPARGIPAGRNWELELYHQMRACRAVVILCSAHSAGSKWCFAEIALARSLGKAILPVRIDGSPLPEILHDTQFVDLVANREAALELLVRGLIAAGLDPSDAFAWDTSRAPYPGLVAFHESDAAVYFGRDDEIRSGLDLMNRISEGRASRFAVVVGPSGSGKSSLVRAGLIPRLRRDEARWIVLDPFRPRDQPGAELAAVWRRAFERAGRDPPEVVDELDRGVSAPGSDTLLWLAAELRRATGAGDASVMLVSDQLEELLRDDDPAPGILSMLRASCETARSPLVVLATLRSDFLGAFHQHPEMSGLRPELFQVGRVTTADVAQMIEQPADVAGLSTEVGLVQEIVSDLADADALPLLAFTLRELYNRSNGMRMQLSTYREFGGVHGAVARVADELLDAEQLSLADETELRRALMRLVSITDDERWVRRVAQWDELPRGVHPILQKFVDARLLVAAGDGRVRTIEVAHETLFRSWRRLADWLQANRETLRLQRDLNLAATNWDQHGCLPEDLWRGARLARSLELIADGDLLVGGLTQRFVDASTAELRRSERAREYERNRDAAIRKYIPAELLAEREELTRDEERLSSSTFLRMSADVENRKTRLSEMGNLVGGGRWHSRPAVREKNLGAMEDYSEVWRFPCCDEVVVMGDGPPSQFRDDGCDDVP